MTAWTEYELINRDRPVYVSLTDLLSEGYDDDEEVQVDEIGEHTLVRSLTTIGALRKEEK